MVPLVVSFLHRIGSVFFSFLARFFDGCAAVFVFIVVVVIFLVAGAVAVVVIIAVCDLFRGGNNDDDGKLSYAKLAKGFILLFTTTAVLSLLSLSLLLLLQL